MTNDKRVIENLRENYQEIMSNLCYVSSWFSQWRRVCAAIVITKRHKKHRQKFSQHFLRPLSFHHQILRRKRYRRKQTL